MAGNDREIHDMLLLIAEVRRHGDAGTPIRELSKRLKIPTAKIAEYANRLLMCGKPPFQPDDYVSLQIDQGRVYLDYDQSLGVPLRLTTHEALALVVALAGVAERAPAGVSSLARSARAKVRAGLSQEVGSRVDEAGDRIALEAEPSDDALLDRLREAAARNREVEIRYYAWHRDEMTTRRVHPYLVTRTRGAWYVIGQDQLRGEIRTFRLERILDATETGASFERAKDFDPDRFRRSRLFVAPEGVREAKVRFFPPVSRRLASELSAGRVKREKDGSVVVTLEFVSVAGLANWILAFGAAAEVLEPAELRKAVADRARKALAALAG